MTWRSEHGVHAISTENVHTDFLDVYFFDRLLGQD